MNKYIIICLCTGFFFSCQNTIKADEEPSEVKKYSEISWQLIGPGDADQVSAISISQKGTVYVSTDIGGVYKSNDWSESWKPINEGIKNYDIVTPVIISPDNEDIIYIGTRGGIYKSINGGETWDPKWNGIGSGKPEPYTLSACIGAIAFDPDNSANIYAGTGYRPSAEGTTVVKQIKWNGNIYRSSDRGEKWEIIASLGEDVMITHLYPVNSQVIYSATNSGLFKSSDFGKTWKRIFMHATKYIIASPENPDSLYLAAGERGLFKSSDGGKQWVEINSGLSMKSGNPLHTDNYTQILIDSKEPETIYSISTTWGGGGGVYKSLNRGDSWNRITRWNDISTKIRREEVNVESAWLKHSRRVNTIAMDPNDNDRLFIGTSRYIYRTDNGGRFWQQLISRKVAKDTWTHRGMNIFGHTRVVGIDPVDASRLYIGTADHGLVKSEDGGTSWKESIKGMVYTDNIYDIVVDAKNNSIVYVINGKGGFKEAGVAKSYNYGETWQQMNNGLKKTMYHTIVVHPENSDTLCIGGEGVVYMTSDGGKNWVLKNKGIEGAIVRKLLLHPLLKEIIFAATDIGLFKSIDDGASWHKTHLPDINLYTIAVDPHQRKIYAGAVLDGNRKLSGGVFTSIDWGNTWNKVLDVRRIESIAVLPDQPTIVYASSNDFAYHDDSSGEGVFRSKDGGITWEKVNKGLAVLRGFNINIAPYHPYRIYLSSNGSGAYVTIDPAVNNKI